LLGIPLRDFALLWRLVRGIALRQPEALWPFCKTFYDCARRNPDAIDYVGMLAAVYLHLGPFSRFVMTAVDRQMAEIDLGRWKTPLAAIGDPAIPAKIHSDLMNEKANYREAV
jgi:hypothetical protein